MPRTLPFPFFVVNGEKGDNETSSHVMRLHSVLKMKIFIEKNLLFQISKLFLLSSE